MENLPQSLEHSQQVEDISPQVTQTDTEQQESSPHHSWKFWLVFLSLSFLSFASALDGSIITTALPTVTHSLGTDASSKYIWIANSFTLAQTAVQPLIALLCNIFGRRNPLLISIALFTIGSGVAGGASNVAMMISGRTIQGLGSGGIYILVDLIVCDLTSLRDRGKYLGIVLSTAAVGAILGPVAGGGLAEANWSWVFYINIPISGAVFIVMWLFLDLVYEPSAWSQIGKKIDWIGQTLFIASITSILLGLTFGGVVTPWSSYRTILPLLLGTLGWIAFHGFEASPWCYEASVPPKLFANRTSTIGFTLAFDSAMLLQWTIYFLPIYFQGVKSTSPLTSGINTLPYNAFLIPAAIVARWTMSRLGVYRPLHNIGFGFITLGVGLLSILTPSSPVVLWVIFQMFTAIGQGFVATSILTAIQAALPDSEIASATGMYAFLRSFGFVWEIAVPSLIFNAFIDKELVRISDSGVRETLAGGNAYAAASIAHVTQLPAPLRAEIEQVYQLALQMVWRVAIAFALFGFVLSFGARQLELSKDVTRDFRMNEKQDGATPQASAGESDK